MKYIKLATLLLLPFSLLSQKVKDIPVIDFASGDYSIGKKVKILYDKDWKPVTAIDSADFYRVVNFKEKNISLGRVVDFYISGEKKSSFNASYIGLNLSGIDSVTNNGPSVYYHKNGNKSLISNFFNDKKDGSEISYYESNRIESQTYFEEGLLQGEQINYYKSGEVEYKITYVDGLAQGEQIGYYQSGEVEFKTNWVDDLKQGEQIGYYQSGDVDADTFSGKIAKGGEVEVCYYFENGVYKGQKTFSIDGEKIFDNTNSLNTKEFNYPSGFKRSITEMKNEKENGLETGYHDYSGSLLHQLNWVDGKRQGEQIGYYESGEVEYKRNWVDNLKQGEEINYYKSGEVKYKTNWVDDLLQGEGINYYKSGEVESKITYVDGLAQGEQIGYYQSGEVGFKRNWVDDLKQGEEISYYESGEVEYKINWVDGLVKGEHIGYYESGEVQFKKNWVDNLLQGEQISYYKSGEVQFKITHVDGLVQGEQIGYYESGEVKFKTNWVDDLKQGEQIHYFRNGKIDFTELYLDNKRVNRKIALVIGNAAYLKGPLENPVNDANLIAKSLEKLDFEVELYNNLSSRDEMLNAIKDFGRKRKNYEIGFVYYAGHGIQLNNENYLLPVNEEFEVEGDLEDNGVSMQRVLRDLKSVREGQLNIIVLDACRDNPFESNWNKTRSLKGAGLAKTAPPKGSLIAFSTDHGQTAADGDGANSLYSQALAEKLLEENVSIEQVFKNVRTQVLRLSGDTQSPVEESKLTGDAFYLNKT
jgi:antitoxin component YwqK of YwqJK toxin-antitoxin module